MNDRIAKRTGLLLALACLAAGTLWAADLKNLTKKLFVIPSTTGNEDLLAGKIRGLLPRGGRGPMARALGAVDIPLSWPGSYAHSLIEKIDRRDLEALSDLILAVISDWK